MMRGRVRRQPHREEMTLIRRVLAIVVLMCAVALPRAQAPASPPTVTAIKGATILTVTKGAIENGTIVLRNGKIAAIGGADTAVPAGADIVDATGKFVSPGIVDCHSHIAADSINEGGTTVSSMTGIEDVLNPTDPDIYRDLAGGTTTANVLHGSANPIGGKNQVIKLRWGKTRPDDFDLRRRDARDQVRAGRKPEAARRRRGRPRRQHRSGAVSRDPHGRRVRDPRRVHARQGVSERVAGLRSPQEGGRGRRAAAARPAARAARRSPRRQAPRARPLVPRRRNPDAHPHAPTSSASRSRRSSTCSKATRSRRRSRRTAPARRRSPTGGGTRSRRSTPSRRTRRS